MQNGFLEPSLANVIVQRGPRFAEEEGEPVPMPKQVADCQASRKDTTFSDNEAEGGRKEALDKAPDSRAAEFKNSTLPAALLLDRLVTVL